MSRAREPGRASTTPRNSPAGCWLTTEIHKCPPPHGLVSTYCPEPMANASTTVSVTPYDSESEDKHSCFQMGKLRLGEMKQLA